MLGVESLFSGKCCGFSFIGISGWIMVLSERYSLGANATEYGSSCCVFLAELICLRGEVRVWHSSTRWKMRKEEQLFIEIREEFVGTVVALCLFNVHIRMVCWAVIHLSSEVTGFHELFVHIGACVH